MSIHTTFPNGTFCWPELCSGDAVASNAFYAALFGWEAQEYPMPDGSYWGYKLGGVNIGGMYETTADRKAAGVRPHWNLYAAVDDADAICAKVKELGGKVHMDPMEMDGVKLANLEDNAGAKFCVWQVVEEDKAESTRVDEVGTLCWSELATREADKAKDFYTGLFGWKLEKSHAAEMEYTMFAPAGTDSLNGGIMTMTPEMPGEPSWVPYFAVENADQSAAQAKDLGGSVIYGPMDVETAGRIYYLLDDQGAQFAIIQQAPQAKES